jgi:protein-disulfide isomerase-like protein with CxxC motif
MNKGVQILLERVKSNPEEFMPDITGRYPEKWRHVLVQVEARANAMGSENPINYLDFLSDAEVAELWRAMQEVRGDQFTKQIMNTLLRESDLELSSVLAQRPSASAKGGVTKVTALDIKVAKELGMTLGDYIRHKDEMGINT